MSRLARLLIALVLAPLLAAASCQKKPTPDTAIVVRPEIVEVPVILYRDLPAALLADCPIAEGSIPEIGAVAAARKLALINCNIDKEKLRALQGTRVPDD